MDLRTGKLYESEAAAREAGARSIVPVELVDADTDRIVRITNGPYKGRVYQREQGSLRRRKDLEAK